MKKNYFLKFLTVFGWAKKGSLLIKMENFVRIQFASWNNGGSSLSSNVKSVSTYIYYLNGVQTSCTISIKTFIKVNFLCSNILYH